MALNIKNTSVISFFKKRPLYRPFYLLFSVVLIFSLFNGVLVKKALADDSKLYVDNVYFYYGDDNVLYVKWHVKQTFSVHTDYWNGFTGNIYISSAQMGWPFSALTVPVGEPALDNYTYTFEAGQTYTMQLYHCYSAPYLDLITRDYLENYLGWIHIKLDSTYYFWFVNPFVDTDTLYYFAEYPNVSITYPTDNSEIAGTFNIQGTYTNPAVGGADYLKIDYVSSNGYIFTTVGAKYIQNTTSGNFSIPISGVPAGTYDFYIYFEGGGFDNYVGAVIHNIKIVKDIPQALPTGETTPTVPIYPTNDAQTYHAEYCTYGTDTTPFFNTLTNAVGGIVVNIGQNLADFANKFNLTDAQNTGTQMADAILTMRTYLGSVNSFFNGLPVAQILILYLIVFVLVILFRIIKGLINLIKP
jgi:hypothetical protein